MVKTEDDRVLDRLVARVGSTQPFVWVRSHLEIAAAISAVVLLTAVLLAILQRKGVLAYLAGLVTT